MTVAELDPVRDRARIRLTVLEAVNHSDVLMESLDCPMTKPVAEQTLSPMQELNAEGQICEAQGAAAAEGGGSPWASK
ncbi:hypothetical protein CFC21_037436 [Triticum aestivum]|uniref:Uncharacterized protein n=4 Tax=Triticum TaxID=4564 RepID=A0A9R0RV46_TRITD|nr:hypothetical protein TRIUR3_17862 [Triticum urartu]KAF7025214.1 hypothetical protein CFC21_037436 [Triticum aestivum]VAH67391.1 unnamed protein product [Triticum turgidum subsp. durum]